MHDAPLPDPVGRDEPRWAARDAALARVEQDELDRASMYARTMRNRAELAQAWEDDTGHDEILELAGTARIGQDKADTQLLDARVLTESYPRALELLEAGLMRVGTVELLLHHTRRRTQAVQAELGRRILDRIAPMDAVDARRLIVATLVEVEADLDAAAERERHERARANRGVWVKPVEDGMARIGVEVDQLAAQRFALDLEELVRAQKVLDDRDGVTRSQAQRRADVLAELPSRHLALLQALGKGQADALLAQALAGTQEQTTQQPAGTSADRTAGAAAWQGSPRAEGPSEGLLRHPRPPWPSADELPLDLPPRRPPRCWDLPRDELVVQLLRLPVRNPTTINVHIPMSTVLELDHRAGFVEGLGAVPARRVRQLLPIAALRRVAVDPHTGLPLGVEQPLHAPVEIARSLHDPHLAAETQRARLLTLLARPMRHTDQAEPAHDPSRRLRRQVELRDQGCTGPGCATPAHRCDLDHETTYANGGPTAFWNLGAKSPRCHHARHRGWTVERDETTGTSTWTSPTGRTYTRLSPWQRPPSVPDDLSPFDIPLPQDEQPRTVEPDRPDAPLWRPPQGPKAEKPEPPKSQGWYWPSDEPPPF